MTDLDVRMFTVGVIQENAFLVRAPDATSALMIDPGEEPDRLLHAIDELGVTLEAILLTHTHFDHIGAVAPVAKATGATVYCPKLEVGVLADTAREQLGLLEGRRLDAPVAGRLEDLPGLGLQRRARREVLRQHVEGAARGLRSFAQRLESSARKGLVARSRPSVVSPMCPGCTRVSSG